jgi:hypothetical protein
LAGLVLGTTCLAGVVAVGWLSRRRVPILTTLGLTLAVVGYTCLAIGNSFGELSTALVASHPPIHLASVLLGSRPLDLIGWGGTALGFAAAGWALLYMNNAGFDLPPERAQVTRRCHSSELRSSGTSTAYRCSRARSIASSARALVEASTTGGAAPVSWA